MTNLLDHIAKFKDSDKAAHIYRNKVISYSELNKNSDSLAYYIKNRLKDSSAPIVVFGHKDPLMIICFLAVAKSGRAYIPIDISMPENRIIDIINDSRCEMILSTESMDFNSQVIDLLTADDLYRIIEDCNANFSKMELDVNTHAPFYIMYTSGSTGKPKGVVVTLQNINSFIDWSLSISNCDQNTIFLNQAPFSFDLSVMDLYTSLASGSTLFSIDKPAIENLREAISLFKESKITHWVSTPSFIDLCLSTNHFNAELLPSLKMALFCGEILSTNTAKKIRERFPQTEIINFYGPTEATVAVTSVKITDGMIADNSPLPVGHCKKDCFLEISGARNEGEKGEIIIFGDSVALEYYENPELTKAKFIKKNLNGETLRGYKTGDKGYIKESLLYYCGRNDFQIKLNGYRIELEDIENNIRSCENVRNAIILPKYADQKISSLIAFVSLEDKSRDINEESLRIRKDLAGRVPAYMIPRKIAIVIELPMNANGKVNRQKLAEVIANGSL